MRSFLADSSRHSLAFPDTCLFQRLSFLLSSLFSSDIKKVQLQGVEISSICTRQLQDRVRLRGDLIHFTFTDSPHACYSQTYLKSHLQVLRSNHVILCQAFTPSPRYLCRSSARPCRTMQSLPGDVLPQREQQGKAKVEERRRRSRSTTEGGREMDSREHHSPETLLALAPADRSYASPTPQPPTFFGSPASTRPRGRTGAVRPSLSPTQPSPVGVETRIRPPLGQRTQTPPPRPRTAETVPSQLIGGRAGSDARRLRRSGNMGLESDNSDKLEDDQARARRHRQQYVFDIRPVLRSSFRTRSAAHVSTEQSTHEHVPSPSESPAVSTDNTTGSSKGSRESGFAYFLRNRRLDKRLLQKRSQPPQHRQKRRFLSPPAPAETARSPSYFRPKIVEDTLSPLLSVSSPPPSSSHPSSPSSVQHPGPVLHYHVSTSHLPLSYPATPGEDPASPATRKVKSHSPIRTSIAKRPGLHASPRLQASASTLRSGIPVGAGRELRVDLPPSHSGLDKPRLHSTDPMIISHRGSISEVFANAAGPFTPIEISTLSPRIAHGDHYFRTFGEDTMYIKHTADVATQPLKSDRAMSGAEAGSHQTHVTPHSTPSQSTVVHINDRKRGSPLVTPQKFHLTTEPPSNSVKTPSPAPYDPTKSYLALSRHTRTSTKSDGSTSSYFGIGRRNQHSSDHAILTPSPNPTQWDRASPPAASTRDRSSPLLPSSLKAPKLRWSHQVTTEPAAPERGSRLQELEHDEPMLADPTPHTTGGLGRHQSHYHSSDGRKYPATSLTAPDAPSFLPSEMKRVRTPPLKEAHPGRGKLRTFKSYFLDSYSVPSEQQSDISPSQRGFGLLPRLHASPLSSRSLQSLATRLSLSKILETSSQSTSPRRSSDPVEVTEFYQTPFSQRYGDARRAKQTQMRAYIWEETLRGDEDSVNASIGGTIELNIPEHLTNSPLCPLNEKHRSGGKGVCPIHGRKRMTVNATPPRSRTSGRRDGTRGGRREPTIVFDSGQSEHGAGGMRGVSDEFRRTDSVL